MKIIIDKDKCLECLACEEISEGLIKIKKAPITVKRRLSADEKEMLTAVTEACPGQAIKISED